MGVVGGSIAGCAMAIAGSRAGADVTVYERSSGELQDRGLGIVIPPALHERLLATGYLDASMPTAPVATRVWLTRSRGQRSARELARQPSPVTPCNWGCCGSRCARGPARSAITGASGHRRRTDRLGPGSGAYGGCRRGVRHRGGRRRASVADPAGPRPGCGRRPPDTRCGAARCRWARSPVIADSSTSCAAPGSPSVSRAGTASST
ncbi:hypothetical protein NKH18_41480 [Streptomyces sp. M10(2022)]